MGVVGRLLVCGALLCCVCPGARVGSPRPMYLFIYLNEMTHSPPAWFEKRTPP
jgi:hypothetical protein